MLKNPFLSKMIPAASLEGVSVIDTNLNHVVSIASLSDEVLTLSQQSSLESILTFPGFTQTFQYYFENNNQEGIPSSLFGPVVIQLQPGDTVASLLYLERAMGKGFFYTIVLKDFELIDGLPSFSDQNLECIHFASRDQIRSYFDRIHPSICLVSTLISLANAIFIINYKHDAEIMNFLHEKIHHIFEDRKRHWEKPAGLLLAPFGRTKNGDIFSIESQKPETSFSEIEKNDFAELVGNLRVYLSPLLDSINRNGSFSSTPFIHESIGPIRMKWVDEETAEGLFLNVRSNTESGYEFWIGKVPFQGEFHSPRIDSAGIQVKKKRLTSLDFLQIFPSISSLEFLLPLALKVYSILHPFKTLQKTIDEIIEECKKTHPNETRFALRELAQTRKCHVDKLTEICSSEEIQLALYNSIRLGEESKKVIREMRPYRHLGNRDDVLVPGSPEEFMIIQKERMRAVRDEEYRRRVKLMNQKFPLFSRK